MQIANLQGSIGCGLGGGPAGAGAGIGDEGGGEFGSVSTAMRANQEQSSGQQI